ncbi:flagellar hook-length control protein FliK [bacterium CPR1]|nr:flagellar hook-length control protein FliK [bacterium CPR1]
MENPLIATIVGTSGASPTSTKATREKGDADAFSRELDKATGDREESGKTRTIISDEKTSKKDEPRDAARKAEAERAENLDQKLQQKHMSKLNGYLFDLAYKNPDTLSLGEKQSMRLAEFSSVGLHDLRWMLTERGLQFRDLSFTQLALVTRDGARNQVSSALDQLVLERKKERDSNDFDKLVAESQPQKDLARELRSVQLSTEARAQHQAEDARQNRQMVIDQVLQHIEVRNLANKTELSLKLNPEYLGDLRIKLVHGKEGIKAEFETTSRTTREVIEENEEELRSKVADRGVRLNEVTVKLVETV